MRRQTALFLSVFLLQASTAASAELRLDGRAYEPAEAVSQRLGLRFDWDPLLRNATFSGPGGRVRFHTGGEFALAGERLVRTAGPVRMHKGQVFLPLSETRRLRSIAAEAPQAEIRKTAPAPRAQRKATRPQEAEMVPTPSPVARHRVHKITVDAGHGGRDSGAISPRGTKEKDVALDLARKLAEELERLGFEVLLTRPDDTFVELDERARLSNAARSDFFVSVHANAAESASLRGFETYTLTEETDDVAVAERRAGASPFEQDLSMPAETSEGTRALLWDLVASENRREAQAAAEFINVAVENSVETEYRRLRDAGFRVLKWTECPAVLVEAGYLTSVDDERLLKSPLYRRKLAAAIAQGILRYKETYEKTRGFTE